MALTPSPSAAQQIIADGDLNPAYPGGSPWNVGGDLAIGNASYGSLTIQNGGSVTSPGYVWVGYQAAGDLVINGGSLTSARLLVANQAGTSSSVVVTNGTITTTGNVGNAAGIAQVAGSTGTVTLNDNSVWNTVGSIGVGMGDGASGTLNVLSGSKVNITGPLGIGGLFVGNVGSTSQGAVTVDGIGSEIYSNAAVLIGATAGAGTLTIQNGGSLHSDNWINAGGDTWTSTTASGAITVTGTDSTMTAAQGINIGAMGQGVLNVLDGADVTAGGALSIGSLATGNGVVTVDGSGTSVTAATVIVGDAGVGELTIANGGAVNASGGLTIAAQSGSTGTLNLGAAAGAASTAPGELNAPTVNFGDGAGKLVINHSDETGDYAFSAAITGTGAVDVYDGFTSMTGASTYAGPTTISGGTLAAGGLNTFSSASDYDVGSNGTLDLAGNSNTIGSLLNGGTVRLSSTANTTLTTVGDYAGNGGLLEISTVLGDDSSATDRLVVNGNTSGNTNVSVYNMNGAGAPTVEGIKVIEVAGLSDGNFSLQGNYQMDGNQYVIAGAYAYGLFKNGVSNPTDGDWYLRSQRIQDEPTPPGTGTPPDNGTPPDTGTPPVVNGSAPSPLYQPAVPVYEAYPQVLLGLNGLPTLQQRVGNRYWNGAGNRVVSEGADAIAPIAPAEEAGAFIEKNGVWGRVEGAHTKIDPRFSTSSAQYELDSLKLQAGVDGMLHEGENGRLIGGVTVHYVRGSADISSPYDADNGGGRFRTDGYGLGGTLTWYGDNGFYLDAQGQATWYDSDLSFGGGDIPLVEGNDGFGYALSLEGGKRIMLNDGWSVTPQAQLVYSSVDFDDFNDAFNTDVSLGQGDSLQGWLGVTLDHESSWYNSRGMIDRTHVYGIANLYNEFLDGTKVNVSGTNFTSRQERLWGGLGVGGSYNWNNDKYSVYGEGSVNTSLSSFGDSYSYKGTLGFRVSF